MATNLIYVDPEQEDCHGDGGLLLVRLVDPLSQLISSTVKLPFHAVGFYYREQLRPKYNAILFNTYDNRPVPWLPTGSSLRRLYTAAPVEQIICYPLVESRDPPTIAAFRAAIVEIVRINLERVIGTVPSYAHLLKMNTSDTVPITGYTLVNKVLLRLAPAEALSFLDADPAHLEERLGGSIYESKSLNPPISLRILSTAPIDPDQIYVEMSIFYRTLGDLIEHDPAFRAAILKRDSIPPSSPSLPSPPMGSNRDEIPDPNMQALSNLGDDLAQIVSTWDQIEMPIIDLGKIIGAYNQVVEGTNINSIGGLPADPYRPTLSRGAVLILPGSGDGTYTMDSDTVVIPTHHPNLSALSQTQLMDLLIYIDSLNPNRASARGLRYAGLQNQIVHELAIRRQSPIGTSEI